MTPNPGTTGISEVKFNLRYPGQYADEESGLFYNGFRTYSSATGRYTQGDPIGLDGGWNRFGYVDGDPVGTSDPNGLQATIASPIIRPTPVPIPVPIPAPSAGTLVDPVAIPNTGTDSSCPPNPGNKDPCKGLRRDLEEHKEKLKQYLNDPISMDNQGSLRDAMKIDNWERFWIIRAARIKSLSYQIRLKEEQLRRCEEKYGFS